MLIHSLDINAELDAIHARTNAHAADMRAFYARAAAYDAHPARLPEARMRAMFLSGMSHAEVCAAMRPHAPA